MTDFTEDQAKTEYSALLEAVRRGNVHQLERSWSEGAVHRLFLEKPVRPKMPKGVHRPRPRKGEVQPHPFTLMKEFARALETPQDSWYAHHQGGELDAMKGWWWRCYTLWMQSPERARYTAKERAWLVPLAQHSDLVMPLKRQGWSPLAETPSIYGSPQYDPTTHIPWLKVLEDALSAGGPIWGLSARAGIRGPHWPQGWEDSFWDRMTQWVDGLEMPLDLQAKAVELMTMGVARGAWQRYPQWRAPMEALCDRWCTAIAADFQGPPQQATVQSALPSIHEALIRCFRSNGVPAEVKADVEQWAPRLTSVPLHFDGWKAVHVVEAWLAQPSTDTASDALMRRCRDRGLGIWKWSVSGRTWSNDPLPAEHLERLLVLDETPPPAWQRAVLDKMDHLLRGQALQEQSNCWYALGRLCQWGADVPRDTVQKTHALFSRYHANSPVHPMALLDAIVRLNATDEFLQPCASAAQHPYAILESMLQAVSRANEGWELLEQGCKRSARASIWPALLESSLLYEWPDDQWERIQQWTHGVPSAFATPQEEHYALERVISKGVYAPAQQWLVHRYGPSSVESVAKTTADACWRGWFRRQQTKGSEGIHETAWAFVDQLGSYGWQAEEGLAALLASPGSGATGAQRSQAIVRGLFERGLDGHLHAHQWEQGPLCKTDLAHYCRTVAEEQRLKQLLTPQAPSTRRPRL